MRGSVARARASSRRLRCSNANEPAGRLASAREPRTLQRAVGGVVTLAPAHPRTLLGRQQRVLEDGHVLEGLGNLIRPTDAQCDSAAAW